MGIFSLFKRTESPPKQKPTEEIEELDSSLLTEINEKDSGADEITLNDEDLEEIEDLSGEVELDNDTMVADFFEEEAAKLDRNNPLSEDPHIEPAETSLLYEQPEDAVFFNAEVVAQKIDNRAGGAASSDKPNTSHDIITVPHDFEPTVIPTAFTIPENSRNSQTRVEIPLSELQSRQSRGLKKLAFGLMTSLAIYGGALGGIYKKYSSENSVSSSPSVSAKKETAPTKTPGTKPEAVKPIVAKKTSSKETNLRASDKKRISSDAGKLGRRIAQEIDDMLFLSELADAEPNVKKNYTKQQLEREMLKQAFLDKDPIREADLNKDKNQPPSKSTGSTGDNHDPQNPKNAAKFIF